MTFLNILIMFVAAMLGGTLNGIAGGGSFLTFPALIYVEVPPIPANATSTTALWPASAAAAWALREELARQNKTLLLILGSIGFLGGVGGALLLLKTPQATFTLLIPYLLLLATALFTLGPLLNARIRRRSLARRKESTLAEAGEDAVTSNRAGSRRSWLAWVGIVVALLVISIYGGYFGGGIGILTLAALGLIGMEDINDMNAVKNILAACINGIAIVTFVVAGAVIWFNALVMVVGAIIGGYGGVYFARKLDQRIVRGFVILVGCVMTAYFFYKYGFF